MACPCDNNKICVYLWDACSTSMAGQTVKLSLGGSVIATATTDSLGHCCFTISAPGTYTISTTVGGTTYTVTRTTSNPCNQAKVVICLSGALLCIVPYGCNGIALLGTSLSFSAGTVLGSSTYSGSPVCVCVAGGTSVTVTGTHSSGRFDSTSQTYIAPSSCESRTYGLAMNVNSGYACFCVPGQSCAWPLKKTLHLTENRYGSTTTLNYQDDGHGNTDWYGTTSINANGCGDPYFPFYCPGGTTPVAWSIVNSNNAYRPCHPFLINSTMSRDFDITCPGTNIENAFFHSFTSPIPSVMDNCTPTAFREGLDIQVCPENGPFVMSGTVYDTSIYGNSAWGCMPTDRCGSLPARHVGVTVSE